MVGARCVRPLHRPEGEDELKLIEAFSSGTLPAYGVPSVTLFDPTGLFLGFYTDPQAFHETITLQ